MENAVILRSVARWVKHMSFQGANGRTRNWAKCFFLISGFIISPDTHMVAAEDAGGRKQPQGWYVRLKADNLANGWKHHSTLLGEFSNAQAGYDPSDLKAMAPTFTPYMYLVFPHPDWGTNASDYATDFRPFSKGPSAWTFELRAYPVGQVVNLSWEGDPEILLKSQIINVATGESIRPTDKQSGVRIVTTSGVQKFIWRYVGHD